jgi:hypothetical protein
MFPTDKSENAEHDYFSNLHKKPAPKIKKKIDEMSMNA